MGSATIGELVKSWRSRRSCSQMALALGVGVSTRHLSFVETGRSKPSPQLVLALAKHLELPLRERNTMLLAAGYAPRFSSHPLDAEAMRSVRSSLHRVLDGHDPFPGLVLDRQWNIVMMNRSASCLFEVLPPALRGEPVNLFRVSLHPDGLAQFTTNLEVWGPYLLGQLDRVVAHSGDAELRDLRRELESFCVFTTSPPGAPSTGGDALVVTCELEVLGLRLSLFTTLTIFGSPRAVTVDELVVELFFPGDDATDRALRSLTA